MEVLKITLPDKTALYTHNLDDSHWQKVLKHWVGERSDEYELVTPGEQGTGKKHPTCNFELLDMAEAKYREMRPYAPHPTCRLGA